MTKASSISPDPFSLPQSSLSRSWRLSSPCLFLYLTTNVHIWKYCLYAILSCFAWFKYGIQIWLYIFVFRLVPRPPMLLACLLIETMDELHHLPEPQRRYDKMPVVLILAQSRWARIKARKGGNKFNIREAESTVPCDWIDVRNDRCDSCPGACLGD